VSGTDRPLIALAGLAGLLGVALSARAAHVEGGGSLDIAARFLLIHAAALLGLAALVGQGALHPRLGRIAAGLLVAGTVILGLIGLYAPASFMAHFIVFALACFVGFQVIWSVSHSLT